MHTEPHPLPPPDGGPGDTRGGSAYFDSTQLQVQVAPSGTGVPQGRVSVTTWPAVEPGTV